VGRVVESLSPYTQFVNVYFLFDCFSAFDPKLHFPQKTELTSHHFDYARCILLVGLMRAPSDRRFVETLTETLLALN